LAKHGVRVGGVAPGVVDTPMLKHISDEAMTSLVTDIPLGRIGKPEEIWLAVKFIIACEFFTGRVIEVDGGASF
jgi:3-oxoacyl-[acyl-carrier protein] reductase